MKWLGIILTAALAAIAPSYANAQQQGNASPPRATQATAPQMKAEPAPPAKSYSPQEKQAYQKKIAKDLAELQEKIHDLSVKVQTVTPQMKRTMLRTMQVLQKQSFAAKDKLAALEKASEKDWGGLKAEMEKTMQELTRAYEDIEARLQ